MFEAIIKDYNNEVIGQFAVQADCFEDAEHRAATRADNQGLDWDTLEVSRA